MSTPTIVPPTSRPVPAQPATPGRALSDHHDPGLVDALALGAAYLDELVVGTARHTHMAIAKRAFELTNKGTFQAARVPEAVHNGLARTLYGSLSLTLRTAAEGLHRVGARGVGPRLNATGHGRVLQSAVNGLIGEKLDEDYPHLALRMSVRVDGLPVPLEPEPLRAAFPYATDRIVVFIHGLGEHEGHWHIRRTEMGGSYGSRLEMSNGWTPVYLRVNTGLPVAENGVALTALLQQLTEAWPVPVRRVALVGHSMGGLISRAACAVTTDCDDPWTERLSDVITLGTPHLGADLANAAERGAWLLQLLPEMAGFGRILEHRSPGIRDLERGLPELPPLPHVRYRLVSSSLGKRLSPWGALFGDGLVRRGSATGRRRALRLFPGADVLHLDGVGHLALLNHADVYAAMRRWLA